MPNIVNGAVYPYTINMQDVYGLRNHAENYVSKQDGIVLYVTGASIALAEVIRAAYKYRTPLKLMHFDRATRTYYPQTIIE
jgi:predicted transcriptional regulator